MALWSRTFIDLRSPIKYILPGPGLVSLEERKWGWRTRTRRRGWSSGVLMWGWNVIWSLCRISLNGRVADALAPQGGEDGWWWWWWWRTRRKTKEANRRTPWRRKRKECHHLHWKVFWHHLHQKKRQQRGRMMLIPQSKSPLYPQHTHHHTSPVSLLSHRVTVKLALPLCVSCCLSPAL